MLSYGTAKDVTSMSQLSLARTSCSRLPVYLAPCKKNLQLYDMRPKVSVDAPPLAKISLIIRNIITGIQFTDLWICSSNRPGALSVYTK